MSIKNINLISVHDKIVTFDYNIFNFKIYLILKLWYKCKPQGRHLYSPIMTSVIVWDDHVSLQDWLIRYQANGFVSPWKLDTWRFLSTEKAENCWGWQLEGSGERQLCEVSWGLRLEDLQGGHCAGYWQGELQEGRCFLGTCLLREMRAFLWQSEGEKEKANGGVNRRELAR